MTDQSKFGVYIGNEALFFTEVRGAAVTKAFSLPIVVKAPHHELSDTLENDKKIETLGLEINKLFTQENGGAAGNLCLSLPSKDIIFRSFVIPWMNTNEVEDAVKFEAKKYIPFNLDELIYTISPITITDNNVKKLKIVFVAIKIVTLDYYKNIFSKAGFLLEIIEPSAMSMIRGLALKRLVPEDGISAIIEHNATEGKIIVVDNQTPQFVREFSLLNTNPEDGANLDYAIQRLINESVISLEYYNRQNPNQEIDQLLYMTNAFNESSNNKLSTELSAKIVPVDINSFAENNQFSSSDFVNAFGCTLFEMVPTKSSFFLNKIEPKALRKGAAAPAASESQKISVKTLLPWILACCAICAGTYFLTSQKGSTINKKIIALKSALGADEGRDTDTLLVNNTQLIKRVKDFETIRLDSDNAFFLATIPNSVTEGMWLENIEIKYAETPLPKNKNKRGSRGLQLEEPDILLEISGNVYVKEIKAQFSLVNEYLRKLKSHKKFTAFFNSIELDTVKSKTIKENSVTFFKIVCK